MEGGALESRELDEIALAFNEGETFTLIDGWFGVETE